METAPQITFTPSLCKPDKDKEGKETAARYSGTITLRAPTFDERLDLPDLEGLIEDSKMKDEDRTADGRMAANKKRIAFIRVFVRDHLDKFFVSSTIKRADGVAFDSLTKMKYDSDFFSVFIEAVTEVAKPYHLGNGSTPTP